MRPMSRRALAGCAGCLWSMSAWSHDGKADAASGWTWEPWFVLSLLLCCGLYVAGCRRLHAQGSLRAVLGFGRIGALSAGIAALIAALASPLDALAEHLFSAHMAQHLLLMIIAPPLLVWGRPLLAWLWAFPLPVRRTIARWWTVSALHGLYRVLMHPLPVWLGASLALWLWHIPALYDLALADENVHIAEHLCFFLTSLAFWTWVVKPYGARSNSHGIAVIMVVTFALHSGLLGALLTFASQPLYRATDPARYGLSAMEDQQLAGLIMWVPTGIIYLAVLAVLFVGWLNAAPVVPAFRSGDETEKETDSVFHS